MGVILGIDIGGSATKIVGLRPDESVIGMLRVKAEDSITSLYGALGSFLCNHGLSLGDLDRIVLTGVGAADAKGDIYGVPTVRVGEFPSIGTGGLALSGKERALVVSLGTGTAFIWADQNGTVRHLAGSGIGGGTLAGLSSLITGTRQYSQIRKLVCGGDLNKVDLTIGSMSHGSVGSLPPEATAANFANLSEDATPADLTLGLVNMVLQCIGTMCVFACENCGTKTVVLTGALTMLPPAEDIFSLFTRIYGIEFIIPENATFATAIGAALYSLRHPQEPRA